MSPARKQKNPYGLIVLGFGLIIISALFMLMRGAIKYPGPQSVEKSISRMGVSDYITSAPEGKRIGIQPILPSPPRGVPIDTERKITKTATLNLLVDRAEIAAEVISNIAKLYGGFVTQSQIYERDGAKTGSITIQVRAASFDRALAEIKTVAREVESEVIHASDVTEQYVDLETRLLNLKAQEKQYLAILKTAKTVEDTLNVTQYLNQARSEIDQIEGQLQYLSNQVDMAYIEATLIAESEVKVFGIRWKPLTIVKQSLRAMLEGVAGYINTIIALFFYLPVLILWGATFFGVIFIGGKIITKLKR